MIKPDYVYHFIAGAAIYIVSSCIILFHDLMALSIVAAIGTTKELYDSYKPKNRFDVKDLLFTIAGGLVAFGLKLIL